MSTVQIYPLTIENDGADVVIVQPLPSGNASQRIRLTREMIPVVIDALQRLHREDLVQACREVLS